MKHTSYNSDQPEYVENLQEFYDEIREYYDELFPPDDGAATLISGLVDDFRGASGSETPPMCRYLGVGCATGTLENAISDRRVDVTGIDKNPGMIETSQRRMTRGYASTRFFEMSALEMRRFLKPGSFNIIGCLSNTLPYLADETLTRKFLHDAKDLLAEGGKLLLQFLNFDSFPVGQTVRLPDRSSVRVTLTRTLTPVGEGKYGLEACLERGNGSKIELDGNVELISVTRERIEAWGREAGFASFEYGADCLGRPWTPEGAYTVAILG